MKVITWNCAMAYRNKAAHLLSLQPDIVVVPECEELPRLIYPAGVAVPDCSLWFGDNIHKGLGIFSYGGYKLTVHAAYDPAFKFVVPVRAWKGSERLMIYAVWANNPGDPEGRYVTQVWKAINHYTRLLRPRQTLLLGDFNSNTIWDKPRRTGNHSTVVEFLRKKNIHSTYHHYHRQLQGKEAHPTLYLYRRQAHPYHLDYCFASADLMERLECVEIGEHSVWSAWSDHMPVIVTFRKDK